MQTVKTIAFAAMTVAPLTFAIPAAASDEATYGEPTYTCNIVTASGTHSVYGEGSCTAINGAKTSGLITTGRSFVIASATDPKQKFHCSGGDALNPGGNADTPTSITGNNCG